MKREVFLLFLLFLPSVSAQSWIPYTFGSVILVSLLSFIGVVTLSLNTAFLRKVLLFLVSFSAGILFGDAFIHLLPEAVAASDFTLTLSLSVLAGITLFFAIEKFVHWTHCHIPTSKEHPHPFATMNLIGDGLHNFVDGLLIAASYFVSIPLGVATTVAVFFHEIPQEIGDFGVLLHGGFSTARALLYNFISAIMAVFGAFVFLLIQNEKLATFLLPLTAGGFIYIAGSDLIPELHKERKFWRNLGQLLLFLLGIGIMLLLLE